MITHCFIDLDGVIADFATAAMSAHGYDGYNFNDWPAGEWDFHKVLGLPSDDEFWQKIDNLDPYFWPDLQPYPWLNELLFVARETFEDVSFLTSPSRHESSYSGKRKWAKKHLPVNANLILCKTKHLLAREDRLLIDDSDKNVAVWEKAGGKAILFPRRWNALHGKSDMPMVHVGMELQRLLYAQIESLQRQAKIAG